MALATWQEVEDHLHRSRGIIVPIGSTEQHGPNGLIGTDHLCAECIANGVGEAVGDYVAPGDLLRDVAAPSGVRGSATLRPSTLMLVVRDIVQSLRRHGFERFFFINGHGGNIATATTAFDEIYAAASLGDTGAAPVMCRLAMWSGGPRATALARDLYGNANGNHATAAEVSLAQFYRQQAIKHAQMSPKVAPPSQPFYAAADYRTRYPDGRIGSDPSLSSPEHGAQLYEAAIADMSDAYRAFLAY